MKTVENEVANKHFVRSRLFVQIHILTDGKAISVMYTNRRTR